MSEKRGVISKRLIEIADSVHKKYPAEDQEELFADLDEYLRDLEDEVIDEIEAIVANHLEENEEDDEH